MPNLRSAQIVSLLIAVSMVIAACGSIPYRTARNCPIPTADNAKQELRDHCKSRLRAGGLKQPVPRAREKFLSNDKDLPTTFVGLALSGGGSRASNFAMAVMEQLDVLGFLQHVTAISSTSGGGLAGAYYALHGPKKKKKGDEDCSTKRKGDEDCSKKRKGDEDCSKKEEWDEAKKKMAVNFIKRWIFETFLPHNLVSTLFTHEDSSDLMSDIFDDQLFNGKKYEDLGSFGKRRPIFIANATDTANGSRFPFTQESFRDKLNSRLDTYPISHAVMASAAFPAVFNTVTLRQYPQPSPGTKHPAVPISYKHLIDGGSTDNLGIESLILLADSHNAATLKSRPSIPAPGCFIFVVDAYASGINRRKALEPNPRGALDYIVDLNVLDAFDSLLKRRRRDSLASLGIGQNTESTGSTFIGDEKGTTYVTGLAPEMSAPSSQLVQFDVPKSITSAGHPWSLIRPVGREYVGEKNFTDPPPVPEGYFRCTAWHLNLSGLMNVKPYRGKKGQKPQRLRYNELELSGPIMQHRAKLSKVVTQTKTDFKLSGPPNCSEKLVQEALYAAAHVTVREDHFNRTKVCEWFEKQNLPVSSECKNFPQDSSQNLLDKLDLQLNLRSSNLQKEGRLIDTSVACIEN